MQSYINYLAVTKEEIVNNSQIITNNNIFVPLKNTTMEWLIEDIIKYAIKFGAAIFILLIGFWVGNILKNFIRRRMIKRNVDPTIRNFIVPLLDILFKILVVITSIGVVGFHITSFAAVLGGLAIGVGMAMQGSLSNFAGGILIIIFKPFKVGDYIESQGHGGTVSAISILYTTIITPNRQEVILPNSVLLNNPVKNFSSQPLRRLDIKVGISYNDDYEKVKSLLIQMFENEPLVVKSEPVTVEILEFGPDSVNLAIRAFIKIENYWDAYFKLHQETKHLFDANQISIPFPQREVHLVQKSGE